MGENWLGDNRNGCHILPRPTCHENSAWQTDTDPSHSSAGQSYYWFVTTEENRMPEETHLFSHTTSAVWFSRHCRSRYPPTLGIVVTVVKSCVWCPPGRPATLSRQ